MRLLTRLRDWLIPPQPYNWPGHTVPLPGDISLHLVGSVHMGTPDMSPLPAALLSKLSDADALLVEADIVQATSPFGQAAPCPPLAQRLNQPLYQQLRHRLQQLAIPLDFLDDKPCWQIALILQMQQAQRLGFYPHYGVDYQLLQAARHGQTPVIELEGNQQQLDLLMQLPADGEMLLHDALTHWHSNARLLQMMASWWTGTAPPRKMHLLPDIFSDELHSVLLRQRNQQWNTHLRSLPAGRYIVAVGALHLYGMDNLPALLRTPSLNQ